MDEIELLDKALEDCYGFENWISSMLCKLRDIDAAANAETSIKTFNSKRTRPAKKAKSKNKTKKETTHSRLNSDKSNNAANTNINTTSAKTATTTAVDISIAAAAASSSSNEHLPNVAREAHMKPPTETPPSSKKRNRFEKEEPKRPRSFTDSSDTDSNDSGICVRRRSSQECISAYTKVNKRYLQVKRSVESLMVEIRNMDEIINRQKDVFHINATGINNETYICHH